MRIVASRTDVEHVVSVEYDEPVRLKRSWAKNDAGMTRLTARATGVSPNLDRLHVSGRGRYYKQDGTLGNQPAGGTFISVRDLPGEVVHDLRRALEQQVIEHLSGR